MRDSSAAGRRGKQAEYDKQHSIDELSPSGSHIAQALAAISATREAAWRESARCNPRAAVAYGPLVLGVVLMGEEWRCSGMTPCIEGGASTIGCSPCSRSELPRLQCTRTTGSRSGVSSLAWRSPLSPF